MEVTATLNQLLKERGAPQTKTSFSIAEIDGFLKTATSIKRDIISLHSELSTIRQAYLSTAAPRKTQLARKGQNNATQAPVFLTDENRNEIDKSAKDMLRGLNARIRLLTNEELVRQKAVGDAIKKKYGRGLGNLAKKWAAGGAVGVRDSGKSPEHEAAIEAENQIVAHYESILLFLQQRLQDVAKLQKGMMETRLTRDMEKNRSVLAKARGSQLPPGLAAEFGFADSTKSTTSRGSVGEASSGVPIEEEEKQRRQQQGDLDLTDEQRQIFEKDNKDMLKHYHTALDKVRTAEKSILEISELHMALAGHITVQASHVSQLVADSEHTTENVGGGNKELKKASQKKFSQARATFYAASGLCLFLIVWDLII